MKFYRQINLFSCGPTAVYNALSYLNYQKRIISVEVKSLQKIMKSNYYSGTEELELLKYIKMNLNKEARMYSVRNISQFEKYLTDYGQGILLYWSYNKRGEIVDGHYSFFIRNKRNQYIFANYASPKNLQKIDYLRDIHRFKTKKVLSRKDIDKILSIKDKHVCAKLLLF